jgi:mRNA interferase RelE/StbE
VKTRFRKSFLRDLKRVKDRRVLAQVEAAILEVEGTARLSELAGVRKVSGSDGFFRLRIGDYRIGLAVEGEAVEFVRVLHRKEIYRHFP